MSLEGSAVNSILMVSVAWKKIRRTKERQASFPINENLLSLRCLYLPSPCFGIGQLNFMLSLFGCLSLSVDWFLEGFPYLSFGYDYQKTLKLVFQSSRREVAVDLINSLREGWHVKSSAKILSFSEDSDYHAISTNWVSSHTFRRALSKLSRGVFPAKSLKIVGSWNFIGSGTLGMQTWQTEDTIVGGTTLTWRSAKILNQGHVMQWHRKAFRSDRWYSF
jgi:hypothetical protein